MSESEIYELSYRLDNTEKAIERLDKKLDAQAVKMDSRFEELMELKSDVSAIRTLLDRGLFTPGNAPICCAKADTLKKAEEDVLVLKDKVASLETTKAKMIAVLTAIGAVGGIFGSTISDLVAKLFR